MKKPKQNQSEREHNECLRKTFYATRSEAERAAMKVKQLEGEPPVQVYKCSFCAGYHLGHDWKGWLQ